jgi:hypothetical protein
MVGIYKKKRRNNMEIGLSYFRGDIEAGAEDEVFFKIESGHFTDKAPHKNFELSIRCLDEETGQAMVNAAQEFFRLWKKSDSFFNETENHH